MAVEIVPDWLERVGCYLHINIEGCALICLARGSIIIKTHFGERGHPCQVPFVIGKEDKNPEVHTLALGCV